MLEKPIHLNTQIFELLVASLKGNPNMEEILKNPSNYLLHEIKIFDTPDMLLNIVFDIDNVDHMFTGDSIIALKNGDAKIPVKRLFDGQVFEIDMKSIKDSFDTGCEIDYIEICRDVI